MLAGAKTSGSASLITMVSVATHPTKSVTTTSYVPATRLERSSVLSVKPPGPVQAYVNGAVPPFTVRSINPLFPPSQETSTVVYDKVAPVASVIVAVVVSVQPLSSVTVTV